MGQMISKVAVVTGGGSGIGKATALRLAKEGAKVSVIDNREGTAQQTAQEIEQAGGTAFGITADISNEQQINDAFQQTIKQYEHIDAVFANGGILGRISPIELMTGDEWDHTMTNNVKGAFLTVKAAIPFLKKSGGSIVLTSSVSGERRIAQPGFSAYSTSKSAIAAFMKMAALELAHYKIRVNSVNPGTIDTNIFDSSSEAPEVENIPIKMDYPDDIGSIPLTRGELGTSEQVANLVFFLLSDEASHISGTEMYVDGAESLLS